MNLSGFFYLIQNPDASPCDHLRWTLKSSASKGAGAPTTVNAKPVPKQIGGGKP